MPGEIMVLVTQVMQCIISYRRWNRSGIFTNGQLLIGNTTGNTLSKSTLTAGSNISITNGNGTIETATTHSVGDGGLTQNNFTDALKSKLDGIAAMQIIIVSL